MIKQSNVTDSQVNLTHCRQKQKQDGENQLI